MCIFKRSDLTIRVDEFGMVCANQYISADPGGGVTVDRSDCSEWEAFHFENDFWALAGSIIQRRVEGQIIRFFVTNPADEIQRFHRKGRFYEREELNIIREYCRPERISVDVGANIGNHSVFLSKFCKVSSVLCFEPNPNAIRLLEINLALNSCFNVDTKYLGYVLSADNETYSVRDVVRNNMGGAQLERDGLGDVRSARGDDLLQSLPIGFIKIDVEGMEFDVLMGLRETIAAWRPNMFIEVWSGALPLLKEWLEENRYAIAWNAYDNFMLVPD